MKQRFLGKKHFSALSQCSSRATEKRGRVIDGACRTRHGADAKKTTGAEFVANFHERERLPVAKTGRCMVTFVRRGHRRGAYIAAMLSANTRVRPIYPKG